jgi:hypothetical protein
MYLLWNIWKILKMHKEGNEKHQKIHHPAYLAHSQILALWVWVSKWKEKEKHML